MIIIEMRIPLNWTKTVFYYETVTGFIFIIRHRFPKRNWRFQFMSNKFQRNRVHHNNIYIYIRHYDRMVFLKNLIKTRCVRTLFPSYFSRFNQTLIYIIIYICTWLRELLKIQFIGIAALRFLFSNWSITPPPRSSLHFYDHRRV